jgi:transcriptional regulator with XRE-family HTH domain
MTKATATPIDCVVGNRIRARRMEQRVSQQELGKALGLSFQQVQKYENGTNRVSVGRLQEIADFLKADVPFFMTGLGGNGKQPIVSPFARFLATKEGAEIIEAMLKIDKPALRRTVIDIARQLGRN